MASRHGSHTEIKLSIGSETSLDEPQADAKSTVSLGPARFQVLTGRIIRMEWSGGESFNDSATLAVANRRLPVPRFRVEKMESSLVIRTEYLTLTYRPNGRRLGKTNLQIAMELNGKEVIWHPGLADKGNLKGTTRSLDTIRGSRTKLGDGLISRGGWSVVDDSNKAILRPSGKAGSLWPVPPADPDAMDWYFLGYGHQYKECLREASGVFGRQPLLPRFALGYWWSRYWAYTDKELEHLVWEFNSRNVPIDVLVLDMEWHKPGWTGYTWDRHYFPDHEDFLRWVKSHDLKVALNLHPAAGVGKHEQQFEPVVRAMGLDKKRISKVPFDHLDPRYMEAYFKHLHNPHEKKGVDFWWLDWVPEGENKLPSLDRLRWLNYLHWHDMESRPDNKRPLVFSRFGGLGSGRHPLGFSGDTISVWESLAFQPYFTSTAANVLFGCWSHDIGGFTPGDIEPELYTRWIQFGIFSPVLRTHTMKNPKAERRVWEYPDPFNKAMIEAIRRRYEMVPYIYTENRKCSDSGVSLCRPMYYDHPESLQAYECRGQYMFGEKMLVAPVVHRREERDNMAAARIWLPEGEWFDTAIGDMVQGGRFVERRYLIDEIPAFVPAGTVLPGQAGATRLKPGPYPHLTVTAYPGGDGEYLLYEDDGVSRDYLKGQNATIRLSQRVRRGVRRVTVGEASGTYAGFSPTRSLELRLPAAGPPKRVTADGRPVKWQYRLSAAGWNYDERSTAVIVRIPAIDLRRGAVIEIESDQHMPAGFAMAIPGTMRRLEEIKQLGTFTARWDIPEDRLPADLAQACNRIARNPESFVAEITHVRRNLGALKRLLTRLERDQKDRAKAKAVRTASLILDEVLRLQPRCGNTGSRT